LKILGLPFQEFHIIWPAEPTNYVLQFTTGIGTGWSDITEGIVESGGWKSFIDTFQAEKGFYRLRP
jgi:hypothetical protein